MKFVSANWPAPKSIRAYTTTKQGFGERQAYQESYVGFYTSNAEENKKIRDLVALPSDPIWLKQTHSITAVLASPENQDINADASYTTENNRVCVVLTADCLPILICNKAGTEVAAIHAGWRGLVNGIIENTIAQLKSSPEDLLVWFGPAIGPEKFEVGHDVYQAFTEKHAESAQAFVKLSQEKWLANLYQLARLRLNLLGVTAIYGGDLCTYTQDDLFFSYRRDQGKTGRMASLIWINDAL